MNNQRNNNSNRRRGRGNNRGGNSGGGNQGNRIDSRARGNAPQMLEKYRKLAQEAQLNDDRVQTEYYLQFADHYFRVIADGRATKDDGRPQQGREQNGYDGDDFDEDRDEQQQGENRRDEPRRDESRRDEPRRDEGRNRQQQQPRRNDASDDDGENRGEDDNRAEAREPRSERRPERRPRNESRNDPRAEPAPAEAAFEVRPGAEGDDDQGENPFTAKPRRKTRARKPDEDARDNGASDSDGSDLGFNPAMLPPAIGRGKSEPVDDAPAPRGEDAASDDGAEKPRRRLKMPRARSGDEEELAAVD